MNLKIVFQKIFKKIKNNQTKSFLNISNKIRINQYIIIKTNYQKKNRMNPKKTSNKMIQIKIYKIHYTIQMMIMILIKIWMILIKNIMKMLIIMMMTKTVMIILQIIILKIFKMIFINHLVIKKMKFKEKSLKHFNKHNQSLLMMMNISGKNLQIKQFKKINIKNNVIKKSNIMIKKLIRDSTLIRQNS